MDRPRSLVQEVVHRADTERADGDPRNLPLVERGLDVLSSALAEPPRPEECEARFGRRLSANASALADEASSH